MRGIVLAGGIGSRLWPVTKGVSKQLLPVHDKPMIYYPISTLMLAGIREIAIITTEFDKPSFTKLLGDGNQWGVNFNFITQDNPNGIPEAFLLAENYISGVKSALILGDNIFHGLGFGRNLKNYLSVDGAQIFAYEVANPSEFGVIKLSKEGSPIAIIEKPKTDFGNLAIPGLYFYGEDVVDNVKKLSKSKRGELEISSLNQIYLDEGRLHLKIIPRGTVWLDGGTTESLHASSEYVRIIEERQGLKLGCIEEIAWRNEWITSSELEKMGESFQSNQYGKYLLSLIDK